MEHSHPAAMSIAVFLLLIVSADFTFATWLGLKVATALIDHKTSIFVVGGGK
jgi:hypothetical protein